MKVFVYRGCFDAVTNGHLDVICRAAAICDRLIVAVGSNESKRPTFTVDERIALIKTALEEKTEIRSKIEIESFSSLLIDFARKKHAKIIIKGLRAMSDFEYEFQMALLNKHMAPDIETLFMMTNINYAYLSSSAVREIVRNGGNVDGLVPDCIKEAIVRKFS